MIKTILFNVCKTLYEQGFHVLYYTAYTTNSAYIKLDYGTCHSITIRDHKGKKHLAYRYNVFIDGSVKEPYSSENRNYYSQNDIDKLITDILNDRESLYSKYGDIRYSEFIDINKKKLGKKNGFWSNCKEYKPC